MEKITYRVEELGTVVGGGTPSTQTKEYWDGDIPWISPADLTGYTNVYISKGAKDITEEGLKKSSTKLLPKGTVLLSSRAPIGYLAIAENDICTNQGFKSIICNENIVNNKYLYYFLKLNVEHLKAFASGATFPELSGNRLKRIKLNIAKDIDAQKRIADILSTYDNLIENNNKRIKLLEQMAENLYKEWFVRFRFPDYEAVNFEEKKPFGWIVSSCENTKIPSCFDYCEFSELGSFTRGRNITAAEMVEGEIPVISAGLQPSGYHNKANVIGRSLTISASGANAGYLQYNLSDIWAADCSYYQNEKNLWFVYCTLKFLQPVISNLQCGAAQPHVYPKNINKLCVLKPTDELIVKFNQTVEPFFGEIETLKKKNDNLTKQRDLLLPRLMSGKLEV